MINNKSGRALVLFSTMFLCTIPMQALSDKLANCSDWEAKVKALNSQEKELLSRSDVIYRGSWIFSRHLLPHCESRQALAWYFKRVIEGRIDESVARFGWLNSETVNMVVAKVWPLIGFSEAVPSDGGFTSEAWALLRQPWMTTRTLTSVLRKEIQSRGLSAEAVFTLLSRPLAPLKPDLLAISSRMNRNSKNTDLFALVGATVLLHTLGEEGASDRFIGLESLTGLNANQRSVIIRLKYKAKNGETILWSDFDRLISEW